MLLLQALVELLAHFLRDDLVDQRDGSLDSINGGLELGLKIVLVTGLVEGGVGRLVRECPIRPPPMSRVRSILERRRWWSSCAYAGASTRFR